MGSQGGGGGGGGTPDPKSHSLARQGSLYSLTLDEVQNQLGDLGKPLSSMNLDELLKSVWSAEANQGTSGLDYIGGVQHSHGQLASASSLNQQSSLTLSRDLTKKTVDEVWKDIQQGHNQNNLDRKAQERRPTLGEMTLEDFLVKAGVVSEPSPVNKKPGPVLGVDPIQNVSHQQAQLVHYQQQNMLPVYMPGHQVQQPLPISANPIMDVTYPETQITISPSSLMGTLSDIQTPGRKRVAPGEVVEKIVERRQKRMIKNRESAARSRARKQAYTHELENKISRLEEENERLKRQKDRVLCIPVISRPATVGTLGPLRSHPGHTSASRPFDSHSLAHSGFPSTL